MQQPIVIINSIHRLFYSLLKVPDYLEKVILIDLLT